MRDRYLCGMALLIVLSGRMVGPITYQLWHCARYWTVDNSFVKGAIEYLGVGCELVPRITWDCKFVYCEGREIPDLDNKTIASLPKAKTNG